MVWRRAPKPWPGFRWPGGGAALGTPMGEMTDDVTDLGL